MCVSISPIRAPTCWLHLFVPLLASSSLAFFVCRSALSPVGSSWRFFSVSESSDILIFRSLPHPSVSALSLLLAIVLMEFLWPQILCARCLLRWFLVFVFLLLWGKTPFQNGRFRRASREAAPLAILAACHHWLLPSLSRPAHRVPIRWIAFVSHRVLKVS